MVGHVVWCMQLVPGGLWPLATEKLSSTALAQAVLVCADTPWFKPHCWNVGLLTWNKKKCCFHVHLWIFPPHCHPYSQTLKPARKRIVSVL